MAKFKISQITRLQWDSIMMGISYPFGIGIVALLLVIIHITMEGAGVNSIVSVIWIFSSTAMFIYWIIKVETIWERKCKEIESKIKAIKEEAKGEAHG